MRVEETAVTLMKKAKKTKACGRMTQWVEECEVR